MAGVDWTERIVVDAARMGGEPCIRGTRITVALIVGSLADGDNPEDLLDAYPQLKIEDIRAALRYAAECMRVSCVVPLAG
ncbi:MAG: DUF433 domain-containing protein [Planctomycetota bacterium]|nr:DUF433 domain-containing protein [Planctomycetota bacterium]